MAIRRLIQWLGGSAIRLVRSIGGAAIFVATAALLALRPPLKLNRTIAQIHFIGVRSVLVVLLTALFTGMVIGLQGYYTLRKFGSEALLGPAVALSLIRELGPVLTALMVVARAGSAMAAEIGIMRISEQIDALELMALSPIKYLATPRLIAAIIAVPLLCSIFDVVGIAGGYLVGVRLLGIGAGTFITSMQNSVSMKDIHGGILKAASFGALLASVCTYKGFRAGYGAEGVGRATTEAVVLSSTLVLIWDYFMTSMLFR